jgi:dihydrodiol dehydrogenase / D-xylose 1-dehydrogenase (NADP)
VKAPFWCSDTIETSSGPLHFPFPDNAKLDYNFTNSAGLRYEAQHVRECIKVRGQSQDPKVVNTFQPDFFQNGLTESPVMSLDESLLIAELMEKVRKDIGVIYPQD